MLARLSNPKHTTQVLLWSLVGLFLVMYATLSLKAGYNYDRVSIFFFGIWAIATRLWQRRQKLTFGTSQFAWGLGVGLIGFALLRTALTPGFTIDTFPRALPVFFGLGLACMVSGFSGLRKYWLEAILLVYFSFVTVPGVLEYYFKTATLSAQVSTVLLWFAGFNVYIQGDFIMMPPTQVLVAPPCSATIPIVRLLEMAFVFCLIYPTTRWQKVVLPLFAVLIALLVNSIRIAYLVILTAQSQRAAFDYWHDGTGAQLFSITSMMVFWGIWELFQAWAPPQLTPQPVSANQQELESKRDAG
jgi:cyanoexosortase A